MPKTSREIRSMARTLSKQQAELSNIRRKHRQTVRNATKFKLKVLAAKKKYEKKLDAVQEEANILRRSLKNFSGSYYKLKQDFRRQANMLKKCRVAKESGAKKRIAKAHYHPSKTCA